MLGVGYDFERFDQSAGNGHYDWTFASATIDSDAFDVRGSTEPASDAFEGTGQAIFSSNLSAGSVVVTLQGDMNDAGDWQTLASLGTAGTGAVTLQAPFKCAVAYNIRWHCVTSDAVGPAVANIAWCRKYPVAGSDE